MTDAAKPRARLLVVEDEALVAMLIEGILVDAGFEVLGPFGQAEQALTCLRQDRRIDAAVLDVNLGGGEHSFMIASELEARGVPYIFLTGYGRVGLKGLHAGVPVLQKPFEQEALSKLIAQVLAPEAGNDR